MRERIFDSPVTWQECDTQAIRGRLAAPVGDESHICDPLVRKGNSWLSL